MGRDQRLAHARHHSPVFVVDRLKSFGDSISSAFRRQVDQLSALMRELVGGDFTLDDNAVAATLQQEFASVYVAVNETGEIMGLLSCSFVAKLDGATMQFEHFIVDERYRGFDVAQKLFNEGIREAHERGAVCVELVCGRNRPAARAFYRRNGFEEDTPSLFRKFFD